MISVSGSDGNKSKISNLENAIVLLIKSNKEYEQKFINIEKHLMELKNQIGTHSIEDEVYHPATDHKDNFKITQIRNFIERSAPKNYSPEFNCLVTLKRKIKDQINDIDRLNKLSLYKAEDKCLNLENKLNKIQRCVKHFSGKTSMKRHKKLSCKKQKQKKSEFPKVPKKSSGYNLYFAQRMKEWTEKSINGKDRAKEVGAE